MSQPELTPQQTQLARETDELLAALSGELQVSLNPHRQALNHLGVDNMGWVRQPYHDEALKIWTDLLRRQPDDLETLHHLAIAHHARAIALETGKDPTQANADWELAQRYWHQLAQKGAFWDRLADLACKNTKRDAVDALREEFPVLYLQMHYDIAFEAGTKNHRTRYHVKLALDSPFPASAKETVRRRTYQRFTADMPSQVWQSSLLDPAVIEQGAAQILKYLERDPGCRAALEDALLLQDRYLTAKFPEFQGLGEHQEAERKTKLNQLKKQASTWRAHFKLLHGMARELSEDMRQKLAFWYRVIGEIHLAPETAREAQEFFELGAQIGGTENEESGRCVQRIGLACALHALHQANTKAAGAKAACDEVRRRSDLNALAHMRLANAYMLLDEFDQAEAVCRAGLRLPPTGKDFDELQEHEEILGGIRRLLDIVTKRKGQQATMGLLKQASEHLQAGRLNAALPLLNRAVEADSTISATYFLRCQCHLGLGNREAARADLRLLKRYAEGDSEVLQAAAKLELMVG